MLGVNSKCVTSVPLNIIINRSTRRNRSKWTADITGSDHAGRMAVQSYEPSPLGQITFPLSVQTLCKL